MSSVVLIYTLFRRSSIMATLPSVLSMLVLIALLTVFGIKLHRNYTRRKTFKARVLKHYSEKKEPQVSIGVSEDMSSNTVLTYYWLEILILGSKTSHKVKLPVSEDRHQDLHDADSVIVTKINLLGGLKWVDIERDTPTLTT